MRPRNSSGENHPDDRKVMDNNQASESIKTPEHLHHETNDWRSEHDTWVDDIHLWQREHKMAELMLYKLERALPHHNLALEEHAAIIEQHRQRISTHEKDLKTFIRSHSHDATQFKALLDEHQLQQQQHMNERQRHKSFRDTHLATIAELMRITKLLESSD